MRTTRPPQLFGIDTEDLIEVTAPGTGIPRRKPRATDDELRAIRAQLENGPCMAAYQAGIHGVVDAVSKVRARIQLVQTDDDDAVPGLRP